MTTAVKSPPMNWIGICLSCEPSYLDGRISSAGILQESISYTFAMKSVGLNSYQK